MGRRPRFWGSLKHGSGTKDDSRTCPDWHTLGGKAPWDALPREGGQPTVNDAVRSLASEELPTKTWISPGSTTNFALLS